jgi:hypothetical protein
MVFVLRFPENHRTFGVIGLPVEADASLSVSIRRRTACSHAAGDKADGGLLVYISIKQDITKVPPLPAVRVQQVVQVSRLRGSLAMK